MRQKEVELNNFTNETFRYLMTTFLMISIMKKSESAFQTLEEQSMDTGSSLEF